MKTSYWFLGVIAILMWNGMIARRDAELFRAYDQICAQQPHNPQCIYSK